MADSEKRHTVMVDLTITEFVDGDEVNRCHLRSTGDRPYLLMAERVLHALAPSEAHGA